MLLCNSNVDVTQAKTKMQELLRMWGKIGSELLCFHLCSYIFPTNHRFTLILSMCIQSPWNGYLKLYLILIFSLTITCCNMPIFEFFSNICKNVRRWSLIFHEGSISVGCLPQKSEKHKDPVRRVEWTCKRRIVLHASMRTSLSITIARLFQT